ncbi:O-antigen polymerase [Leptothrix cholodnii SP-6]|uniref:O-antigen polymerase n=1 Tax=Leptothrix cholodnii (strain ATCC 51168 / LMG 8142 / SP-6) TaxID=395495 RepID=B1XXZ5_LEPCP|nr:O-antigen ligase family protein [Leptothrix cholodnii]ACB32764.1 O-antigen polymerase [Leptothrix cholodnii SP-6]
MSSNYPPVTSPWQPDGMLLAALSAVALPMLLAPTVSPTSTFFNQLCAFAGMALWLGLWVGRATPVPIRRMPGALRGLLLLLVMLIVAQGLTEAPFGQRLMPIATLSLGAALALAAGLSAQSGRDDALWSGLLVALLAAGLLSVGISLLQVFAPTWTDGVWVAMPTTPGRAIGNMRQPNQLSTLLLWACAAAVWLSQRHRWFLRELAAVLVLLVLADVLTASRTGMVGVLMLAGWGAIDRRLPGRVRLLLLAMLAVYALGWWGMEQWSASTGQFFYGDDQIKKTLHGDPSSSRGRIWANTLALIAQHPWTGVGPGAFNFVWSMTPFPDRPVAFFDHSHNLLLQLAVDSGLPFAAAVLALALWVAWRSRAAFTQADDLRAGGARCAAFMLALVLVHSLLEYPLWYAYFLLPTALMAGWMTGLVPPPASADRVGELDAGWRRPPTLARSVCGLVSALGMLASGWAAHQYYTVAVIFEPDVSIGIPEALPQRIARGQRSILFGHHADYAEVTMAPQPEQVFDAFRRPLHHLLDTRLMTAYARALAARGDVERSRHVAARLREFRNPASDAFFAPCQAAALPASGAAAVAASVPFQCEPDPRWPAEAMHP